MSYQGMKISGPGLKRKGAAHTRNFVASQAPQENQESNRNSIEASPRSRKRRMLTNLSPPRSPVTRSQASLAQISPRGRTNGRLLGLFTSSPNRDSDFAGLMRKLHSPSSEQTNQTVVGDTSAQEDVDSARISNENETSKDSGSREFH